MSKAKPSKSNNYCLSNETLEKALTYMKKEGYIETTDTVEDLISFTRTMTEDIPFMVKAKITQWANS